ncbi:MAG: hypothetical protein RIF41_17990, partial [Polyangiaceae bacterium]
DLKDPANAFRQAPFKFPKSITHMRVHFTLTDDGGYLVRAEGWDESPRSAAINAKFLEEAIDAADAAKQLEDVEVVPDFVKKWAKKKDLRAVGETTFEVHGNRIEARAAVTDKQLERIMRFIQADLDQRATRKKKASAAQKAKRAADAKKRLEAAEKRIGQLKAARAKRAAAKKEDGAAAGGDNETTPPTPEAPVSPPPSPAP